MKKKRYKIICIIPARSGSKRVKNKNIKLFFNKPILAEVLKKIKKITLVDQIIVSTDSKKIKNTSLKYGANLVLHRPASLSKDHVSTSQVIQHAINEIKKNGLDTDLILCVYPTSIFFKKKNIYDALRLIQKFNYNFVISAIEFNHPIERSFKINKNKKIKSKIKSSNVLQTQSFTKSYYDAGQFYLGKTKNWLRYQSAFSSKTGAIILKRNSSVDIDYESDWELAKKIYVNKKL